MNFLYPTLGLPNRVDENARLATRFIKRRKNKMSSPVLKKSSYRQRVYQMTDGSIQLVFGEDAIPDGGKLLADHDIVETVVVTDHVIVQ